jgi:hypothetical protein
LRYIRRLFGDGLYIAGARDEWEAIGDAMEKLFNPSLNRAMGTRG